MTGRAKFWLTFLFFLFASVVALGVSGLTWTDIRHMGEPRNALTINGEAVKIPLPPTTDGRVLPEVPVTTSGTYAFMFVDEEGGPVRWDPCQPIPFVISPAGAPPSGEQLILTAVERVSAATGLAFTYEGFTMEVASFDRDLIQAETYGDRFAPLIFGWSDGSMTNDLAETVTGLGGSSSVPGAFGEQRYLVGGVVILDAPDIATIVGSPPGPELAIAVIMHELAHAIGLGHVDDATELMNATNTALTTWGPGDLQGLAIVGAGPCQKP